MIVLEWAIRFLQTEQLPSQMDNPQIYQLVKTMLIKIDAEYFRQLTIQHQQEYSQNDLFDFILKLMERYIVLKDFKKLNTLYQKIVQEARDVLQLLALVLYISVNSDIKQEIIESILGFEETEQRELMQIIQRIDANCEKVVEFKKIVEKIQSIEQENESLRLKIMENEEEYQHHLDQIQEISASNQIISKENNDYEQEKKNIFKELEINKIQEFAQICYLNKQQNSELAQSLQNLEGERISLSQQNVGLKKQLKSYGEAIQRQIKEIEDLKNKCKGMNQEYWLNDFGLTDFMLQIPALPLRDSKNTLNVEGIVQQQKRKLPTDRTQCSNRQQVLQESFEVKNNLHVLISLQELQQEEKQKYNQIDKLKELQKMQIKKQHKLDKKIKKLHDCHNTYTNLFLNTKLIKS